MNTLIKKLVSGFKPACLLCKLNKTLDDKSVCDACWQSMPWLKETLPPLKNPNLNAACQYQWPVDRLIHLYKYQGRLDLLPILCDLLLEAAKPQVQAIVPAPLSAERLKQRGFNQSLLLAKHLSKHWQIPIWQPLNRNHTVAQQHLTRSERLINLEQAFHINKAQCKIIPRKVVVIDDVYTTGSTLNSMQEQLTQLGVQHIEYRVIATADC